MQEKPRYPAMCRGAFFMTTPLLLKHTPAIPSNSSRDLCLQQFGKRNFSSRISTASMVVSSNVSSLEKRWMPPSPHGQ
jgi:hypothetical protein